MNPAALFSLAGKVAVVTGAANGLGLAISEAMVEAGADVVCSDVDAERLEDSVVRLRKAGGNVVASVCDVTKPRQVKALIGQTYERFGRLDILFNNAGISQRRPAPLHETSITDWNRVFAVNLNGVYTCSREALRVMVKQKSGKIINIASIWGLVGSSSIKPLPAYNASKGAVVNLTREMGLEYAPIGINVNAICPGFFSTRLADGAYDNPAFVTALSEFTPMGRVAAPEEVKGAAIFLASRASDYMCGQMLVLDGGVLAK
jgi:NAD(P)-dependent dehydrogenase (short-subunit alcohol dehydrogenase family)